MSENELEIKLKELSKIINKKLIEISNSTNIDLNTVYIAFEQEMVILKEIMKSEYNKNS